MAASPTLCFFGTYNDRKYLPRLKDCVGASTVFLGKENVATVIEAVLFAKSKGATGIISTNTVLLAKLLGKENDRKAPSLDNYAGSLFKSGGIDIVFIHPLEHFITVNYSKFLTRRFISKLTAPETWSKTPLFNWEVLNASNMERIFNSYTTANLIAVDIETFKLNLAIRCVGYTAVSFGDGGSVTTHSCVLPLDSEWALAVARKFNWELKAPKITQNGKYDNSYLLRYNAPLYNWLWDTATMFHCWYAELPKDLGFLGSFFVREAMYWKDLANTNDLEQYYLYNCRDHWTTALVALEWFRTAPDWAFKNYLQEFPVNYPSLLCEMTGVKRDFKRLEESRARADTIIAAKSASLDKMLGVSGFNVNSSVQMQKLAMILGLTTAAQVERDGFSMDEKAINKYAFLHPLNSRILLPVIDIREARKLKSTYLRTDNDITKQSPRGAKEYKGRILYAINPHGTDTGRNASREHHFWCGLQIQNIPRGTEVKSTVIADNSFRFGEVDLEQAESRDTGYISGDEKLIAAVEGDKDFHSVNASCFFGKPYEVIYDDAKRKTKDKPLRDLSKRTNHGANYCMGAAVLVETMGPKEVESARILLKLPFSWNHKQIAEYLLVQFHKTYPTLAGVFYPAVVAEVLTTSKLVGATGWTRYCFGNPRENKRDRNSYVAHCPQSLNAMVLNKAFMRVFYEIALPPADSKEYVEYSRNFKLSAQIHDSILFQFKEGHEYLAEKVKACMEIPVTIKGYDGRTRTFNVPAATKLGADGKGTIYWSDTEA